MNCWDVQNIKYCLINNVLLTGTNSSTKVANAIPSGKTINGTITIVNKIFGKNVREIGQHSFVACTGITAVNIQANLVQIGFNAFLMCPNIVHINIPKTVELIAQGAICTSSPDTETTAMAGTLNVVIEGFSALKVLGYCGIGRKENIIIQYCSNKAPTFLQHDPFHKASSITIYSLAEFTIDSVTSTISDNACIFRNNKIATTCNKARINFDYFIVILIVA